jgi:hypothetical protein
MKQYRVLRAWCITLTLLVTGLLLWLLPSVKFEVLCLMGIVACLEGFFLHEVALQAQAKDEQRLRDTGMSTGRRML